MTDGQRSALIIACDDYHDTGLRKLRAPARDAQELAAVLSDPEVGGFDVRTSLNEPAHVIGETVEEFFADRGTDDLLLVHFSCHGVKDEDGELYFAATNTKLRRLGATAVAAEFVNRRMNRSRSRRIVLLLDCCYAGAFERGMTHRADTGMNLQEQLSGRGRAVITASSAMEYSFESGELADAAGERPSLFTGALVDGLRTGEADRNQDGLITLDDLYDYVYARVRACSPHQTPLKWAFGVQGELYIARRTRRLAHPIPLPEELEQLLGSPLPSVREAAVRELAKLVVGKHLGMAEAAVRALEELLADDSRAVSAAAAAALRAAAPTPAPLLASGAPAAEKTPGRGPAAAVPDPGPPPTRIDPSRSVDDRPSADDHDTRDRHPARSADGGTGRGESAARPSTASQPGLRPPGPRSGDGDRHASHRTASSTTRGRTPRHSSGARSPVPGPPVPPDRARRD
uniref:caspase family protein n=1 Tax=Nocardia thailandica TaxID=257275 RepID=UPI0015755938